MSFLDDVKEHHVWALVVFMIATAVTIIIMIASYYGDIEDKRIAELVREGHNPMELTCLYNYSDDIKVLCSSLFHARANAIEWGDEE